MPTPNGNVNLTELRDIVNKLIIQYMWLISNNIFKYNIIYIIWIMLNHNLRRNQLDPRNNVRDNYRN